MSEAELGGAALAWLLMVGLVSGAASVWALRRWSDLIRFRAEMNRVIAHLMEFRLFAEEPALIVRAQWNLLKANARMLRVLLAPSLLLLIPFVLLFAAMDGFFARAALPIGEPAVITLQGRGNLPAAQLRTPRRDRGGNAGGVGAAPASGQLAGAASECSKRLAATAVGRTRSQQKHSGRRGSALDGSPAFGFAGRLRHAPF